jgi:hypothetical protein
MISGARLKNVGSYRSVGAFMTFSLILGCSCPLGGRCSRRFLETLLHGVA